MDCRGWATEQGLTEDQAKQLECKCLDSVDEFVKIKETPCIPISDNVRAIRKLSTALEELRSDGAIALALLSSIGFLERKGSLTDHVDATSVCVSNLRFLCKRAISEYENGKISKGGKPESIRGRRLLALRTALCMKYFGIEPTKTPDGAFDGLLRIVMRGAGIFSDDDSTEEDKDLKSVRDYAVDFVRS